MLHKSPSNEGLFHFHLSDTHSLLTTIGLCNCDLG